MGPPARKLIALRRALSPPCARNVFADGPGDADDASVLLRAPPLVSRYRFAVQLACIRLLENAALSVRLCPEWPLMWVAVLQKASA